MKTIYTFSISLCFFLVFSATTLAQTNIETDSLTKVEEALSESEIIQPRDLPLVFRRTTLIVRDIKKSLALYKDVMGMKVIYDNQLLRPHPKEDREQVLRLVFLKATHTFDGVLGLLEFDYENENKIAKPIRKEGFTEQNIVLLFNSKNQESQFEKIKKLPFIEVLTEPKLVEYPSYDGKAPIRVQVATFYDPDGFLVEFNKILDAL